jgi:hypothetical protein
VHKNKRAIINIFRDILLHRIINREEKRAFRNNLIKTIICHSRKIGGKNINKTSR